MDKMYQVNITRWLLVLRLLQRLFFTDYHLS